MKKYPNCGEKLSIFALNANFFLHKICECFKLPLTRRIYVSESFWVQPKTNNQILFANPNFSKRNPEIGGFLSPISAPKLHTFQRTPIFSVKMLLGFTWFVVKKYISVIFSLKCEFLQIGGFLNPILATKNLPIHINGQLILSIKTPSGFTP